MPQIHYTGTPVKDQNEEHFRQFNGIDQFKTVADNSERPPHQWGEQRHTSMTTTGLAKAIRARGAARDQQDN